MNESVHRSIILIAAIVGVAVTCRMGFWQLDRAEQKRTLHETRLAKQLLPALHNADLSCDGKEWMQQEQRQAILRGRWLHEKTVVLDNRIMSGRPGFFVLTPLQLDPAPACGRAVLLVQRGWLPRDATDRARIPPWHKPAGMVRVAVRLSFAPSKNLSLQSAPTQEAGLLRQNVEVDALSREWHLALLPGSAQALADDPAEARHHTGETALLQAWWQPISGVEKHHAYAAQWFLMAFTIAGLYLWFQWWRPAKK
jgi:surfeit locus 1 family protein